MNKIKLLGLLAIVIIFSSCEEEGNTEDINSDEISAEIKSNLSLMGDDIVSLSQTQGIDALDGFLTLFDDLDEFSGRKEQLSWMKNKISAIDQVFLSGVGAKISNDDIISFDELIGVWEWNSELDEFVKNENEETDFFIIKFPSEGSLSNNAIFTLSKLELQTFDDGFGSFQLPTEASANLIIGTEEVIAVSLLATYSEEDGDILPLTASVMLDVAPFSFSVSLDDSQPSSSSLSFVLEKAEETLSSINLTVEFSNSLKIIPDTFTGIISYRDLTLSGFIDLGAIEEDGDPNDFIDIEVLLEGEMVGDVVFELEEDEDGYEDYIPYIVYLDGTKEKLEDLIEPVIEEIEIALEDLEG